MKVFQTLPVFSPGDAIGNDTQALDKALKELGYETGIYSLHIHDALADVAKPFDSMPKLEKEDIVIHHLSTGSEMNAAVGLLPCRKIIMYHNITPPEFFEGFNYNMTIVCKNAYKEMRRLAYRADYCLADSDYNKKELIRNGYKTDIDVLPILIPFSDYEKTPDQEVIDKYSDGRTNIIFTGRIAPNKKQEDVIRAFACYKKYYDETARLFIVGSYNEDDLYYKDLQEYADSVGVDDIYFTGHIPFTQILSYYKIADVFLCMSEHEGFCVPLVEAMFFGVPIVAYESTAIPYTLAGSGVLLNEKDYMMAAGVMDRIVKDPELKAQIVEKQKERLKDFSYEEIKARFAELLEKFIASPMYD